MPFSSTVSDLSGESVSADPDEPDPPKRQKSSSGEKRTPLNDAVALRAALARRCKCSKRNCFENFVSQSKFQDLLNFRCHWCSLHKLDQDTIETRLCSAVVSSFCWVVFFLYCSAFGPFGLLLLLVVFFRPLTESRRSLRTNALGSCWAFEFA